MWLNLRTEQMASGHQQLLPPQGYTIADLQAAWQQVDTAEQNLRALIQEALCERAHLERLMATFNRKVGLHHRWLAENGKLAVVLCVADRTNLNRTLQNLSSLSDCVGSTTNSNLLSFLLQEREKLLALQCKHRTMIADTEAHNNQRFRTLQELWGQLSRWTNLSSVLSGRSDFIESAVSMVESIIDVEKVVMDLEVNWDRLTARFLRGSDSELQLTESDKLSLHRLTVGSWRRIGAALHLARSDGIAILPGFLRRKLFARFLALNLPMESLLAFCASHCNNLNNLKQRASMLTDRLQRTTEQRQYLQALTRMTELTFGELQNDNHESIRIISSKFRLIENEISSQIATEATFADCPCCAKAPSETTHLSLDLATKATKEALVGTPSGESSRGSKNWRSLETLSSVSHYDRIPLRRARTCEGLHEPSVLPEEVADKKAFLLRLKHLAREELDRLGRSFHETHLLLMTERTAFLKDIEQYKTFTSVFLELTEVRIELDEGTTWVNQTTEFFSRTQLPAVRSALTRANSSSSADDASLESTSSMVGWWKQLLQTNKLFKAIILYQSTIRRQRQVGTFRKNSAKTTMIGFENCLRDTSRPGRPNSIQLDSGQMWR
ncbi:unnamed protein product [Dibothriocephalus latus]|uniref:Uncharacterized protein n=1 Tax=Dibothriocephalus latus TaxID=60516 RepID=A0A3P6SNN3_DIBLA|nr:unnamed protein product [Dibothriocephalus latus]